MFRKYADERKSRIIITIRKIIVLSCFFAFFFLFGIDNSLPFGFNHTVCYSFTESNIIDVSEYKQKYVKTMDYAAEANVRWWRAMGKFEWGNIQPKGPESWDWSDEDSLVKWSGERNLHLLAVLGCQMITPEWATNKKISNYDFGKCYPPDSSHWHDYHVFVKTLVERYDGDGIDDMPGLIKPIKYWEFTNEPHNKQYFWGTPDQFIYMFKETRKAIKEADREAKIVGPCLTSSREQPYKWIYYNIEKGKVETFFFANWKNMEEYIIKGIGIENIDVISHHLYQNSTNFVKYVNELRDLLQNKFKAEKSIWITEYGSKNSDVIEINYKKSNNRATCIYTGLINKPLYAKVTAQYDHKEKVIVDTLLYLGDTIQLYNRATHQWDTLENFQGGTIMHKDGNAVLKPGDTVQIYHIWLEDINHSYKIQAIAYQELLNKYDKKLLNNLKIFFFCFDNWAHKRYYPPSILFGGNKPIKLYRAKEKKNPYTIIDPEKGPQKAYYLIKDYIKTIYPYQ